MIGIDVVSLYLIIPKSIEVLLFSLIAIKIRKSSNYKVNLLASAAFFGWALYMFLDIFTTTFGGYSTQIFYFFRVIWAIELCLTVFNSYNFFAMTLIIKNGENVLYKKYSMLLKIFFSLIAIAMVLTIPLVVLNGYNSDATIIDPSLLPVSTEFRVTELVKSYAILIISIPLGFYFIGVFILIKTRKNVTDKTKRMKMLLMTIGMALIPLGYVYYCIRAMIFPSYGIISASIGHIIWITASLLISRSQIIRKRIKIQEKEIKIPDKQIIIPEKEIENLSNV